MRYVFKDLLENKVYYITTTSEDKAWEVMCDKFGCGYVLENIHLI